MNFLLDVNNVDITKPIDNFTDKFLYGGRTLLIGIATVFSVLVLLWFLLSAFKFFFHDLSHKEKKVKEETKEPSVVYQTQVSTESDEIVAVIAAAIAMAESDFGNNVKFRVVSFKRK
jgi:sodium pump decarboxylase gamma subunit